MRLRTPVLLGFLAGLAGVAGMCLFLVDPEPVVRFETHPAVQDSGPDWASRSPQPDRDLTMDVVVSGPARRLDVAISYELRVPADDPLLDLVADGRVKGPELGRYLVLGPVNTPVTVERTATTDRATVRFRYAGTAAHGVYLGDGGSTRAAERVHRRLTITTADTVISEVRPVPDEQRPRAVSFSGPPDFVAVHVADDVPEEGAAGSGDPFRRLLSEFLAIGWRLTLWGLVTVMPWVLLVRATRHSARLFAVPRTVALVGVGLSVMAAVTGFGGFDAVLAVVGLVVVAATVVALWSARGGAGAPPGRAAPVAAATAAVTTVAAVAVAAVTGAVEWWLLAPLAIAVTVAGVCGHRLNGWRAVTAVAWAAGTALALGAFSALLDVPFAITLLVANLVAAAVVASTVDGLPPWARAAVVLCGVATVPVVGLAIDPRAYLSWYTTWPPVLIYVARLLAVGFAVYALVLLRRAGERGSALGSRMVLGTALVVMLIAATEPYPASWAHLAATASLVLVWAWLVPPGRRMRAVRLATLSPDRHRELVGEETRRRLAAASAHLLYRRARSRLGEDGEDLATYDAAQRQLDDAARLPARSAGITCLDALSTGGGATPWANAVRAVGYAAPLAALFAGYELVALLAPEGNALDPGTVTVAEAVILVAHLARWFVYALLFGYLYPLLRGNWPITKAVAFVVALLGVEVLPLFDLSGRWSGASSVLAPVTGRDVVLAALIRAGQVVVFMGVLGLLWERWIVREAGYSWDRVRNVRRAGALAAPVGTVVVAILTAVGTAVAGAAVAALLSTGSTPGGDPGHRTVEQTTRP